MNWESGTSRIVEMLSCWQEARIRLGVVSPNHSLEAGASGALVASLVRDYLSALPSSSYQTRSTMLNHSLNTGAGEGQKDEVKNKSYQ